MVTFSLRNPSRDYSQFFVQMRGISIQWWHFIEQTCVITTNLTASQLSHTLLPHIEVNDSLLIVKLDVSESDIQGWLPSTAWQWLNTAVAKHHPPTLPSYR